MYDCKLIISRISMFWRFSEYIILPSLRICFWNSVKPKVSMQKGCGAKWLYFNVWHVRVCVCVCVIVLSKVVNS